VELITGRLVVRITNTETGESKVHNFFDFPAEHWVHLKTSNPIESTFAPVRARMR
jgi:transposase-like protein